MTMVIDGSLGTTFPDSSNQASASKVLQVVQGTLSSTSGVSTSSSSFVTTGLSASITPKFSTSKVFVLVDGQCYNGSNTNNWFTVYRGGTNLNSGSSPASLSAFYTSGSNSVIPVNIMYLDTPATTSSTTYTLYFACGSGTMQYAFNPSNTGSTIATITLMEIAA